MFGPAIRQQHAILVCYSATSPAMWMDARHLVRQLHGYAPDAVFVLAGTKCDLVAQREVCDKVLFADVRDFADEIECDVGRVACVETSSSTGDNVESLFRVATYEVMRRMFECRRHDGGPPRLPYGILEWSVRAHRSCHKVVRDRVMAVICAWRWGKGALGTLPVEVVVDVLSMVVHTFEADWDNIQELAPDGTKLQRCSVS
eukprot:TRINITY_DN11087_c0_g1_i2.p1 TRINITY_DN11087_c0_g1~~TRINITY_DN11087_c0_g1_i2.p1  ORF type:complete len:202 (-),score=40.16 TRINITY_DN11087_c0_g1_i2:982-1587(-)